MYIASGVLVAGSKGLAFSFFSDNESYRVAQIDEYMDIAIEPSTLPQPAAGARPYAANMVTIQIDGGKKDKVRPGDILGALTSDGELTAEHIGKINLFPMRAYVAVHKKIATKALNKIANGKMKDASSVLAYSNNLTRPVSAAL